MKTSIEITDLDKCTANEKELSIIKHLYFITENIKTYNDNQYYKKAQ